MPGRVEPASPSENPGDVLSVVSPPRSPSPDVAAVIGFAVQAKHPLFTPSLLVLIQVTLQGRKG